jgi:hypothetical protein
MAADLFGAALDADRVRVHHAPWWPLQPRHTVMAPDGDLWLHPAGGLWREDYGAAPGLQRLFVHELTHCWQAQRGGRWFLPLVRHPFCRYRYTLKPGRPLRRYGLEQQAEIVADAFTARRGGRPSPPHEALLRQAGLGGLLPFPSC